MDSIIVWLVIGIAAAYQGKRLYDKLKIVGDASPCGGCACGNPAACPRCPANIIEKHSASNIKRKGDTH